MSEFTERERRKPGAVGRPVILADGQEWLLAIPRYQVRTDGLTAPMVDQQILSIFDNYFIKNEILLSDVWQAAIVLLRENYALNDDEISQLLAVSPGDEEERLKQAVVELLFGSTSVRRSYGHWVRASLLATGLGAFTIPAEDIPDVMSILVATNRTVPLTQFVDVCREAQIRASLDALI